MREQAGQAHAVYPDPLDVGAPGAGVGVVAAGTGPVAGARLGDRPRGRDRGPARRVGFPVVM